MNIFPENFTFIIRIIFIPKMAHHSSFSGISIHPENAPLTMVST